MRIAQPELRERPQVAFPGRVVDLVDGHDDRGRGAAQQRCDPRVLLGDPDDDVHHQDDHVGGGDGPLRWAADLRVEVATAGEPAARVHDPEAATRPLGDELLTVPRDAGLRLDDRLPPAGEPVHQRRLPHVRPADDRDHRQPHAHRSAATREAPSVGTTSTARGRSVTATPSRKRARDKTTSGRRYRSPAGSDASASLTSRPVRSPVTAMLPPKKRLGTGSSRSCAGVTARSNGSSGASTCSPYCPVTMVTRVVAPSAPRTRPNSAALRGARYPSAAAPPAPVVQPA